MMRRLLIVFVGVGVAAGAGLGGWMAWRWYQASESAKADVTRQLMTLQQAHEELRQAHEALQQTSDEAAAEAAAEARRAAATASLLSAQLQTLTQEKEAAAEDLQHTLVRHDRLQQELGRLEAELRTLQGERTALAERTSELERAIQGLHDAQQVSTQERARLSRELDGQRSMARQLTDRLSDVSSAYDRLLRAPRASGRPSSRRQPAAERRDQAADLPVLSAMPPKERRRQAGIHEQLGQVYWTMGHYDKAARELEEALELETNPDRHAQLALLYSRFLRDPKKASEHLTKSRGGRLLSAVPLADAFRLPRSSTALLRDHLTE